MKLPRFVTVGHLKLRVVEISADEATARGINGEFDYENGKIELAANLVPSVKAEIALHEVLHAAFEVAKLKATEEGEETFVSGLAPVLLSFIRDNPTFLRELAKAAKANPTGEQ